jgi:prephenate dehydratase
MECTHNRERGLTMVVNRNSLAVGQIEIGAVPLEGITSGTVLGKEDLGAKQPNLEVWEEVSVTLDH